MFSKKALVLLLAAAFVIGYFYMSEKDYSEDFEDGAPELSISIIIDKYDETDTLTNSAEADIIVGEDMDTITPLNPQSVTMSVLEVGVPFVEPTATYIIKWHISVIATPQSTDVQDMAGTVYVSGHDPQEWEYIDSTLTNTMLTNDFTATPGIETIISFQYGGNFFQYLTNEPANPASSYELITGADIDGSTFTIAANIEAVDHAGIFGATSLDIILNVGAGGNIDIEITDIIAETEG